MYIAGDIGGTKTHLVMYRKRDGTDEILREQVFNSQEYLSFSHILQQFLLGISEIIQLVCLGVAGPVKNNSCKTTNLPWYIDAKELTSRFSFAQVILLNDLEASAFGVQLLSDKDFVIINPGKIVSKGLQAIISVGTGLGEVGMITLEDTVLSIPSEGGHVDFSPRNELEISLLAYMLKKFDHVSYERVLSGMGLLNLFQFFIDVKGEIPNPDVYTELQKQKTGQIIIESALQNICPVSVKTLDLFLSLYGAEAGNLALKYLSYGGIFLGGGIPPRLINKLQEGTFMQSFTHKGRFSELLSEIPVKIICNDKTVLLGAKFTIMQHKSLT